MPRRNWIPGHGPLPHSTRVGEASARRWNIAISHRKYGIDYFNHVRIDLRHWPFQKSWLYDWLKGLELDASVKPELGTGVQRLAACLQVAESDETVRRLARRQLASFASSDVYELFEAVEARLKDAPFGHKQEASFAFRGSFWKYAHALGLSQRVTLASVAFQSRLARPKGPQRLLGDYADVLPPLGATDHVDIGDLKGKLRARAESALRQLQDAVVSDLAMGQRLRDFLLECAEAPVAIETVQKLQALTGANVSVVEIETQFPELLDDICQYIGAVLIIVRANGAAACKPWASRSPTHHRITQFIRERVGWTGSSARLLFALEHATATEVHAAGVLLQTHTGWNISSTLELQANQVRRSADIWEIQSYKSKTDTDTPPVVLGERDIGVTQALDLLLWNHQRLIELGLKPASESRLWYDINGYRADRRPGPQHLVQALRARHSLPPFTLDLLRRQRAFIEGLTSAEQARRVAGHKSLATTTIYLNTDIAQRLNSSINLQMQRRLEKEVAYAIGMVKDQPSWKPLLQPIGDGASCSAPTAPPHGLPGDAQVCDGRHCHVGQGCANRRLVIDESRMKEAITVNRMYRDSWQRLHARNPIEFGALHLPAMIFNSALVRLLRSGPYAHLFRRFEDDETKQ